VGALAVAQEASSRANKVKIRVYFLAFIFSSPFYFYTLRITKEGRFGLISS
jgi:hypothetical protein